MLNFFKSVAIAMILALSFWTTWIFLDFPIMGYKPIKPWEEAQPHELQTPPANNGEIVDIKIYAVPLASNGQEMATAEVGQTITWEITAYNESSVTIKNMEVSVDGKMKAKGFDLTRYEDRVWNMKTVSNNIGTEKHVFSYRGTTVGGKPVEGSMSHSINIVKPVLMSASQIKATLIERLSLSNTSQGEYFFPRGMFMQEIFNTRDDCAEIKTHVSKKMLIDISEIKVEANSSTIKIEIPTPKASELSVNWIKIAASGCTFPGGRTYAQTIGDREADLLDKVHNGIRHIDFESEAISSEWHTENLKRAMTTYGKNDQREVVVTLASTNQKPPRFIKKATEIFESP